MLEYFIVIAAYLLGSISTAIVVARVLRLQDPREVGSGNPGATNILRYGGKAAALTTLAGDLLKGVIAVLVAKALTDNTHVIAASMVAVFLGHLYPLYFGFKGGKGVATALGIYLAASLPVGLAMVISWIVVAAVSRYSSLSAIVASALAPVFVWYGLQHRAYIVASIIISAFLFWRHRGNIKRLFNGSETRIGKSG